MEQGENIINEIQSCIKQFKTSSSVPKQLIENFFEKINIDEFKERFPQANQNKFQNNTINIPYQLIQNVIDFHNEYEAYENINPHISEKAQDTMERLVNYDTYLNSTLKNYHESISSLSNEIDKIKRENAEEINQIKQEMADDKKQEIEQLNSQISHLKEAFDNLNPASKSESKLKEQIKYFIKENESLSKSNKDLLRDQKESKKLYEKFKAKNKELNDKIKEIKEREVAAKEKLISSNNELMKKVEDLTKINLAREKTILSKDNLIKSKNDQIKRLTKENLLNQQVITQKDEEINKLKEENEKLKGANRNLQTNCDIKNNALRTMESESKEKEKTIKSLEGQMANLNNQLNKTQNDLNNKLISVRNHYEEIIKTKDGKYEVLLAENIKIQTSLNEKLENLKNDDVQKDTNVRKIEILDGEAIDNLKKIEKISSSCFGKVYKVAKVIKEAIYALKVLKNKDEYKDLQQFLNEYEIINMLSHPNIIKTYGILLNDEAHLPSILLEFCPNNLKKLIKNKNLSKVDIAFTIYQIAEGMKYVHFHDIIHRDLKPSNILVASDGTIKICDFGISKLMTTEEQTTMTSGLGTQKYMAPEIIDEESNYNNKVDVYSFGVLVFFILSEGELPSIKMSEKMKGTKPTIPSKFTNFSREMISKCLNFESNERPSFDELLEEMEASNYQMTELTESEIDEVKSKIKQHKTKIPPY